MAPVITKEKERSTQGGPKFMINRPDAAEQALKEAGFTVSLTDVIAIGMEDCPGAFAKAMQALADACISIEYMYAFNSRDQGRACVILRAKEEKAAVEALQARHIEILAAAKVCTM